MAVRLNDLVNDLVIGEAELKDAKRRHREASDALANGLALIDQPIYRGDKIAIGASLISVEEGSGLLVTTPIRNLKPEQDVTAI